MNEIISESKIPEHTKTRQFIHHEDAEPFKEKLPDVTESQAQQKRLQKSWE